MKGGDFVKEFEGFVKLTHDEMTAKMKNCDYFHNKVFNKGYLCWGDDGKLYISMKDNNTTNPRGALNTDWKVALIDNE